MSQNEHHRRYFEFAGFRLYPHERLLTKGHERIALTPRILDLLIILVERDSEVVSKEALLGSVWAGSFVDEGNISRAISTLRKILGTQTNGSDLIETVPKIGYRFIAPVHESVDYISEPNSTHKTDGKWTYRTFAAGLFVLISLGGFWYLIWRGEARLVGGGSTNLTNNLAEDDLPAWSPDGKKIAFTSNRDGAGDVYVMNSDGSAVNRLTFTPSKESSSVWSPNGDRIGFDSDRDGNREIYIMNSDGSNQTRLTFNPTTDSGPVSFSPDGRRVAFSRNASNEGAAVYNYDIYTMNLDGSDVRQLTTDPEFDAEPIWSPDGSRILFISGRDHNFEVYAINPDGTGETNVSKSLAYDGPVAFTPDGRQIFCMSDTPSKMEFNQVWLINTDGTDRRQITSFTDKVYRIAVSPQAQKFAVSSKKEGNFEIYIIDAPGLAIGSSGF